MMKVALFLALVALSIAVYPRKENLREEAEFQQWMKTHNKVYTAEEYPVRFSRYLETKERIMKKNANSPHARFGHTRFSDLSPEEFKAQFLTARRPQRSTNQQVEVLEPTVAAPPNAFDWRSENLVTAVKDQGQCGSCWAFSATENIESVWMKAHNITSKTMAPLAPQQIVDCDTTDGGCDGGDTITAFEYVIKAGGLETEKEYPYTAEDGTCEFKKSAVYAKISSYKYATDPNNPNENTMQANLYSWAPLSICVDAEPWQDYTGGILMASQCSDDLDHCVQATGYNVNNNPPYWIVRNSWGADWGENGYIRLQFGKNTCGLADEATTAVIN